MYSKLLQTTDYRALSVSLRGRAKPMMKESGNTASGLTTCGGVGRDSEVEILIVTRFNEYVSWDIQFRFVHREKNIVADMTSRLAWQGTPKYGRYMDPPPVIRDMLHLDKADLPTDKK
ncbi:hypothetical protein V6N11_003736 [Hibiscus sabdariffa]|uniref:RNase H type-1 domain-containing protein n=1 Tax=Hibiscus sabdariffa TaxID=183260 RepID=A0ABR2SEB7_9ROSI